MAIVVAFRITSVLDLDDPTGMIPRSFDFFGDGHSLIRIKSEMKDKLGLDVNKWVVVPENRKLFCLTDEEFHQQYRYHAKGSPWHGMSGDEYHSKENNETVSI